MALKRAEATERRRVSKRGALALLDEMESQERHAAICVSARRWRRGTGFI